MDRPYGSPIRKAALSGFRYGITGAAGGLATWLISEPFVWTVARNGTQSGGVSYTLGSFYGWFAHALLGALVVGPISLFVNWVNNRPARALLLGLLATILGTAFTAGADAASDWLGIHLPGWVPLAASGSLCFGILRFPSPWPLPSSFPQIQPWPGSIAFY